MTKQVNTLLASRLVSIEPQCWLYAQYSRRECLDIAGIPSEMEADALGEKVLAIFEKLWCNIPNERMKTCHRISKKNPTVIVKFSRKKDCQQVWDVKRDLRKIKMEDIDLPGQNKLFINKRLSPYYKVTLATRKKLYSLGKTHSFLFRVTQLRSGSAKIVPCCLWHTLKTSRNTFLTLTCCHPNVLIN